MIKTARDPVRVQEVPLKQIHLHPENPREEFDEHELQRLAASLDREGQLQDVVIRPIDSESYQLVCGARRFLAAQRAGWETIRCSVKILGDAEAIACLVMENLQRKDLTPLEEAQALQLLCTAGGLAGAAVAAMIGKSKSHVNWTRKLLDLPDAWKQRLRLGTIKRSHALELLPYLDHPQILAAAEEGLLRDPDRWRPIDGFKENIKRVAAAIAGLQDTAHQYKKVSRQQVTEARGKRATTRAEIAKFFGVSHQTPSNWKSQGAPINDDWTADLGEVARWLHDLSAGDELSPEKSDNANHARRAAAVSFDKPRKRTAARLLTESDALNLLLPYAESRGDLELLKAHIEAMLHDLPN